jgi:3-isopropylmalate/(R)-2-methylmalate dehydratase large subunit
MGFTMAEKILGRAAGRPVTRGDYITASVDVAMVNISTADVYEVLQQAGIRRLWDPTRVISIQDHNVPAMTERDAEIQRTTREAVQRYGIANYYGEGGGVCHQVMVDQGHVRPGELVVGSDSHTCTYGALAAGGTGIGITEMAYVLATGRLWFRVPETIRLELTGRLPERVSVKDLFLFVAGREGADLAQYKAIEYTGEMVERLSVDSRLTLANMAVELGAKFGLFATDETLRAYLRDRGVGETAELGPDPDASYERTLQIAADGLTPQVALPHAFTNVRPVAEVEGTPIQQACIGSCTNGRLEDLRAAAEILRGRRVDRFTRLYVFPASWAVYRAALDEGVIGTLVDAGAVLPGCDCGFCIGHIGVLAKGESCIATSSRNSRGRMGSLESKVFLASPATAAASALHGRITDPRKV